MTEKIKRENKKYYKSSNYKGVESSDVIMKIFWRQNDRFADLFNAVLFNGRNVVKSDKLIEVDTDVSGEIFVDEYKETLKRSRDVVKKYYNGVEFNILGLELQQKVHLAMPLRTLLYDGLGYIKEYNEIKHENKKAAGKITSDEFLSGLKYSDRLHPVVTIVFYYSEKPWDGPTSLKDMMVEMPEELTSVFNDYKINLVQIKDSDKYNFSNEDVKALFDITRNIYNEDFDKIFREYSNKGVTKELIEMIGKITGNDEIAAMAERKNGGDDMLCTAFENYRRDAEDEGRKEGKKEGKIELIRKFMKNFNKSADEAMDILGIDETEKEELKKKM